MNPIIGPIHFTNASSQFRIDRGTRYQQAKPYDIRLPYFRETAHTRTVGNPNLGGADAGLSLIYSGSFAQDVRGPVLNRAYGRFKDKLGETASMGVTIAQFEQASDMIVGRATQLRTFVQALRRADIPGAARALKTPLPPPTRKRMEKYARSKSLSSQILEWNFGWAPTISDIYASCEILTSEPVFAVIKGKASTSVDNYSRSPYQYSMDHRLKMSVYGQVIASVSVANPNLRLLSQLGLVNPLTFAYELVPWSFLLGWVSNVEQVLSSYTDLLGLRVDNPMTTFGFKGVHDRIWRDFTFGSSTNVARMERTSGLYKPTFFFKTLQFQPTRAANAISLLILQLPKK